MSRRISMIAMLICAAALSGWAVNIPIAHAGFEQVVLPCAGLGCFTASNVAGRTGSGVFGTLSPPPVLAATF